MVIALSTGVALGAGSFAVGIAGERSGHEESKLIRIEETGSTAPPAASDASS